MNSSTEAMIPVPPPPAAGSHRDRRVEAMDVSVLEYFQGADGAYVNAGRVREHFRTTQGVEIIARLDDVFTAGYIEARGDWRHATEFRLSRNGELALREWRRQHGQPEASPAASAGDAAAAAVAPIGRATRR